MFRFRVIHALAAAALLLVTGFPSTAAPGTLEAGFRNPPRSAGPHTWWHWMNGNITREGITADLEAMKRIGLGGAQIFDVDCGIPAGPVKFMTPEWLDMVGHAAAEADRLGLELCIHNCAGWSSSGGKWNTPEHAMQEVVWSEHRVKGPSRFSEALPQPPVREGFYRDICVLAFKGDSAERINDIRGKAAYDRRDRLDPDLSSAASSAIPLSGIVNLTGKLETGGRISWDVPEGDWTILRIGHTCTGAINAPASPEGTGLECDKLSKEALDAHWAGMMAKVIEKAGPAAGRSLNNSLIDSYERGHQNWTALFADEFLKRRGYDIVPYLPVLSGRVVESTEVSERFLWDFRRTVADLWAENYVGHFTELCHANGMKSSIEPYGNATFDNLQCGGQADIVMGEFWVAGWHVGESTKLAASASHTYGHKVTGAESFTADESRGRWMVEPYSVKSLGDRVFCDGVNRFIMHRYAHQPWLSVAPGMTMGPWGTHFDRTITWWEQGAAWVSYVSRCQYLLQSGLFAADLCYFYGESGANDLVSRGGLRPAPPAGYDYDGCDSAVVLRRMSVRNGRIVLPDGMSYRVLVLPESRFMTPAMLQKIAELVRAGAVVAGPKPAHSPSLSGYPACDLEVRRIADEVWGDCDGVSVREHRYGRGRVVWGVGLADLLKGMGLPPDFSTPDEPGKERLSWIHRRIDGADAYFVANRAYYPQTIACTFRQTGRVPEFWYPDTGRIVDAPVYRDQGGRITVPIQFDPAGSVFVVFRGPAGKAPHLVSAARSSKADAASGPVIRIVRATYGPANEPERTADVTGQVSAMVTAGNLPIGANNAAFGDPSPMTVKQLSVEYTLNGKAKKAVIPEGGVLDLTGDSAVPMPDFELVAGRSGAVELKAWKAGDYTLKTSDGGSRVIRVPSGADTSELSGPWTLRFPRGRGAPDYISLKKLAPWNEHHIAGVRYFSGTAAYTKRFTLPEGFVQSGRSVVLDLGRVKNFAEVKLNGKSLGVLWKEPFRLDVTGLARPGQNDLEIRVTNLWPNRIIGDAQLPDVYEWRGNAIASIPAWVSEGRPNPNPGRYTFATWRYYNKDSQLPESGLSGPVTVRSVKRLTVR